MITVARHVVVHGSSKLVDELKRSMSESRKADNIWSESVLNVPRRQPKVFHVWVVDQTWTNNVSRFRISVKRESPQFNILFVQWLNRTLGEDRATAHIEELLTKYQAPTHEFSSVIVLRNFDELMEIVPIQLATVDIYYSHY